MALTILRGLKDTLAITLAVAILGINSAEHGNWEPEYRSDPETATSSYGGTVSKIICGRNFTVIIKDLSWIDSYVECERRGGYLAVLENACEKEELVTFAHTIKFPTNERLLMWIGAAAMGPKGKFIWAKFGRKLPINKSVWYPDTSSTVQTSANGTRNCGVLDWKNKAINGLASFHCTTKYFICNFDKN